jgi:quercetin dioxygenase-like cupin family protein
MKRVLVCVPVTVLLCAASLTAQDVKKHAIFKPGEIQWQEASAMLPKGAKIAVLEGDPTQEGVFTLRLWAPDGYRIPPHWHPAYEHVTVISGTFLIGMGEKWDDSKLQTVPAGGFSWMAPNMPHFATIKGETVVQVHAMGPWGLYYVNPADDPRKAVAAPPK